MSPRAKSENLIISRPVDRKEAWRLAKLPSGSSKIERWVPGSGWVASPGIAVEELFTAPPVSRARSPRPSVCRILNCRIRCRLPRSRPRPPTDPQGEPLEVAHLRRLLHIRLEGIQLLDRRAQRLTDRQHTKARSTVT